MFRPELLRAAVVAPLPGARLALLDSGHEVPIELPGQLAALIEAFLAGLGDRRWRGTAPASRAPWAPSQAACCLAGG